MPIILVVEAEIRPWPRCCRCKSWPAKLAVFGSPGEPPSRCEDHRKDRMLAADPDLLAAAAAMPIFENRPKRPASMTASASSKSTSNPAGGGGGGDGDVWEDEARPIYSKKWALERSNLLPARFGETEPEAAAAKEAARLAEVRSRPSRLLQTVDGRLRRMLIGTLRQ